MRPAPNRVETCSGRFLMIVRVRMRMFCSDFQSIVIIGIMEKNWSSYEFWSRFFDVFILPGGLYFLNHQGNNNKPK